MTLPLDTMNDIRATDADGVPRAEMARRLRASGNTVAKYAGMEDLSPSAPVPAPRERPALAGHEEWGASVPEADLGAPRKQRHAARRVYDRLVAERGYEGPHSTARRLVGDWRLARSAGASGGCLELEWPVGACRADFGNFGAVVAGEALDPKPLVATLPRPNDRHCVALRSQRAERLCAGLAEVFSHWGRAPRVVVLDSATEAGRMVRGEVTESGLFSRFRGRYRFESRCCDPCSGNEKGSVENAVGFLRRSLLAPVPSVASVAEPSAPLAEGCARPSASASRRDGRPPAEAPLEDLAAMRALPGVASDAARWVPARADKRGYVGVDGREYVAGPAWHGGAPPVGMRPDGVEIPADRGRGVAVPPRAYGEGPAVRDPPSPVPAIAARPRALGESTIRRDMPPGPVEAIDRMDAAGRRRTPRSTERASAASGSEAACEAALGVVEGGRAPDGATVDALARRIAAVAGGRRPLRVRRAPEGDDGWPLATRSRAGRSRRAGPARSRRRCSGSGPGWARPGGSGTSPATPRRSARAVRPRGARPYPGAAPCRRPGPSAATTGRPSRGRRGWAASRRPRRSSRSAGRTSCPWATSGAARPTWPPPSARRRARPGPRPASSRRRRSSCACAVRGTRVGWTGSRRPLGGPGSSSSTSRASRRSTRTGRARCSRCSRTPASGSPR